MNSIFFSIVIPTYNRKDLISVTIQSLLNQSFNDFEIIVVDDGSTDDTENIVKLIDEKRLRYFKTENYGVAHARNFGIKKAMGTYIGFLDSDDLLDRKHLKTAFDNISKHNFPEVLHLNFSWRLPDLSVISTNVLPKKLPTDIFKGCSLHVNCLFVHTDVIIGHLFNESRALMFAEDWDFFIKLVTRKKVLLINEPTAFLIDHSGRSMRNFDEQTWLTRRNALIDSLLKDEVIRKEFKKQVNKVGAHMDSLISLNCVLAKKKGRSIYYLLKSIFQSPSEVFTRRFFAISRRLLFYW